MRLLTPLAWLIGGATVGGLVGWSGILCFNGTCAITGSWMGGAVFGGLIGLAIAGRGCPSCAFLPRTEPVESKPSNRQT